MDHFDTYTGFGPNEDISALLDTLRESNLSWIAEEIEVTIFRGKQTIKEFALEGKKKKSGYTTIPYTDDEQLRITLRTLKNYFVILYDVMNQSELELRELMGNPQLTLSIALSESNNPETMFTDQYGELRLHFDDLLHRAWPQGGEPYSNKETESLVNK